MTLDEIFTLPVGAVVFYVNLERMSPLTIALWKMTVTTMVSEHSISLLRENGQNFAIHPAAAARHFGRTEEEALLLFGRASLKQLATASACLQDEQTLHERKMQWVQHRLDGSVDLNAQQVEDLIAALRRGQEMQGVLHPIAKDVVAVETKPPDRRSCGCDGAYDNGCYNCTPETWACAVCKFPLVLECPKCLGSMFTNEEWQEIAFTGKLP